MRKDQIRFEFVQALPAGAHVLDVGCWNHSFRKYSEATGRKDLVHAGVDREEPPEPFPDDYLFHCVDVETTALPFRDESMDAAVLSHVLEHLRDPLQLMDEVFRVLRCGGRCYVECPSDRSVRFPSMPFGWSEFRSLNFYDDPTHNGRPQSPQSLYRMLSMYGAVVEKCAYLTHPRVRLLFPYYLLRALLQRDAALLEHTVWWGLGFSVAAVARKDVAGGRRYKVSG